MIRIALIRHCEAANAYDDFKRQLSPNGLSQVPGTVAFLEQTSIPWRHLICSPAIRTRDTAVLIARALESGLSVVEKAELYNPSTLHSLQAEIAAALDGTMLVGHNPGLSDLATELTSVYLALPPSGAVVLGIEDGGVRILGRHLC
ncbi:MAG: hypothetical protein RL095_88 [Verrucomicrobiota bacterium]|jgi:phosphohistidine phosphatase